MSWPPRVVHEQALLGPARLSRLYPQIGPWAELALWHGRREIPVPHEPLAAELDRICRDRLAGLLLRYLREADVTIDPDHHRQLLQASFAWTSLSYSVVRSGREVLELLAENGVHTAVSKGPGIAQHYAAADLRPYSDIDIVIRPEAFNGALELLERHGWTEENSNQQPRKFLRRYGREAINLRRGPTGSVDLHHRLPPWIWSSGLTTADLVARSGPVDVVGEAMNCVSSVDNLLIAALHLVSDRNKPGASLIVWRDLVELATVASPAETAARAIETGLAGWLRAVLVALPNPMGTQHLVEALPADAAIAHPLRLSFTLSERASGFGVTASQFLRLPLWNGLGFLAAMAVPSPTFLSAKYPDSRHHYLSWWGDGRGRLRRTQP